jgi:hypothetical protein
LTEIPHPPSLNNLFELFEFDSEDVIEVAHAGGIDPSYELSQSSLVGMDLSGKELDGFDFSAADLTGAQFADASVFLTDFSYAKVDSARLAGARNAECAIWPDGAVAGFDEHRLTLQRAVRRAKAIHDMFNGPRRNAEAMSVTILGQVEDDLIYTSAVLLDTIGGKIPKELYMYLEYLLERPWDYSSVPDPDISRFEAPDSNIPTITNGFAWICANVIGEDTMYCRQAAPQGFESLPPFFWREKLYYRERLIAEQIIERKFGEATRSIRASKRALLGRPVPWRNSILTMNEIILDMAQDNANARSPSAVVSAITQGLNSEDEGAAIQYFIWELYIASVHLTSAPLRRLAEELAHSHADLFFREHQNAGPQPERQMGDLPGYWQLARS